MIKIIKNLLSKDKEYHLAVSMGADSVAAMFWLRWKGYKIIPIHFNHNLRTQNFIMHEKFKGLCEKLSIEGKSDVWVKGIGTEAECREARLNFYRQACPGGTIITAHHLDDWIESYLLNCLRGHPNKKPFSLESDFQDFKIIHPFLPTRKKDFIQFLERNNWMEWVVEDETNSVIKGSRRNWIRRTVLPEMTRQRMSLQKYAKRKIEKLTEQNDSL